MAIGVLAMLQLVRIWDVPCDPVQPMNILLLSLVHHEYSALLTLLELELCRDEEADGCDN